MDINRFVVDLGYRFACPAAQNVCILVTNGIWWNEVLYINMNFTMCPL